MCERRLSTEAATLFTYAKPTYLDDDEPSMTDLRGIADASSIPLLNEELLEVHCGLLRFRLQTRPELHAH